MRTRWRTSRALYEPLGAPILRTDHRSAELIKYAANAFLATKISFINDIARLCERLGADVTVVAAGIGADERIGPRFLHAGIGFGGSCFPKDVGALTRMAEGAGLHPGLLRSVLEINREAQRRFVARADELLGGLDGREIAVWGLAFKEGTDDLRDSPAVQVVEMLVERGAAVRAHDPAALANAASRLPGIVLRDDLYEAAAGADAVALCTPWPEYASVDFDRLKRVMRGDLLLDGRNMLDRGAGRGRGTSLCRDRTRQTPHARSRAPPKGSRFPHRRRLSRGRAANGATASTKRRQPGASGRRSSASAATLAIACARSSSPSSRRNGSPFLSATMHTGESVAKPDRGNQQRVDVDRLRRGTRTGTQVFDHRLGRPRDIERQRRVVDRSFVRQIRQRRSVRSEPNGSSARLVDNPDGDAPHAESARQPLRQETKELFVAAFSAAAA